MRKIFTLLFAVFLASTSICQDYSNQTQLAQRVRSLKARHPDKVEFESLGRTVGGNDVWVITIGKGQSSRQPAIAIVGGVDGRHLLGVELAIGLAERIVSQPNIDAILAANTYYIFPNVMPDATEQYFARLRYERRVNARATDNDRDGSVNEDPYDDLNNDGMITQMRVESPMGTYIQSSVDPRVMVLADVSKGETGKYLLLSEGIDNDKDGQFNEDGEGGVDFNRNFSFGYRNFQPTTGDHAVSEVESIAVADFLYDAFNVHTVLSFSLNNNISEASRTFMTTNTGVSRDRENTGDSKIYSHVNSLYNNFVPSMAKVSGLPAEGGEFYTWAYQHYGRYSFATQGWTPVFDDKEIAGNRELVFLKWAEENGIEDVFVPWTAVNHPDFPDNKVEVGGIKPFVMYNPPFTMVSDILDEHLSFVNALTELAPRIEIVEVKKEALSGDIFRVSLTVRNKGLMPTINQIGERSYYLKFVTVQLNKLSSQTFLQGNAKTTINVLNGGEAAELTWLIRGAGRLVIEAGTPTAGYDNVEIVL